MLWTTNPNDRITSEEVANSFFKPKREPNQYAMHFLGQTITFYEYSPLMTKLGIKRCKPMIPEDHISYLLKAEKMNSQQ